MSAPVFVRADRRGCVVGRVAVDGAEGRHAATVRGCAPARRSCSSTVAAAGRTGVGRRGARQGRRRGRRRPRSSTSRAPTPRLVVVQALPKGDRGELAVETMTEVGVDEIVPWAAARCVTRWRDARGEKALARWRTTAQAAAKQSRRARFPVVAELAGTRDVADRLRRGGARRACCTRRPTQPLAGARAAGRRRGRASSSAPRAGSAPRSWPSSSRRRRHGVPARADRAAHLDRRHRRRSPSCCPAPPAGR